MRRPLPGEYEAEYIKNYIDLVKDDDIIKALQEQCITTNKFLKPLPEEKGNYAYAENKWTIKEVLGHVIDCERILAYRALCISRGEQQSLPGFNHNEYVKKGNFNKIKLSDIADEFRLLRESNIALFKNFDEKQLLLSGVCNGKRITVRAILFMIAGHEL